METTENSGLPSAPKSGGKKKRRGRPPTKPRNPEDPPPDIANLTIGYRQQQGRTFKEYVIKGSTERLYVSFSDPDDVIAGVIDLSKARTGGVTVALSNGRTIAPVLPRPVRIADVWKITGRRVVPVGDKFRDMGPID